jgi:coenzyme F420 hydrogenase subunit beta
MCCETFDYGAFMVSKVERGMGLSLSDITKVNVKGRVIVTMRDGRDVEIPLKEARPYANEWCHHCPDFAAEHADLSCGGLGMEGWTMILVRSERGEGYLKRAIDAGVLELREPEEEPQALKVMDRLAKKQRQRIKALEPHAAARWPTEQLLAAARSEETSSSDRG